MDDLISEFITETSESIETLDRELVKLEQDPNNAQVLGNIFRLVHTIKGTCGFLGLPRLEAVAHASENVLGKIRDKVITVTPDVIGIVLESLDCIKALVEHLARHQSEQEGNDSELIARLNLCAESKGAPPQQAKAPAAPAVPAAPKEVAPAAKAPPEPAKEPAGAKAQKPAAPEAGEGTAAGTQSIRVNLDVLENLMQMVGELVLTRNQLLQIVRTCNDPVFAAPLQHLSHITTELQDGVMKTRMQPIGNAWSKFPRLIRDLSHDLGKKIDLRMTGEQTELDRQLLEMIKDPLTHMVRNSADHGLETPAERLAAGKSETGTVTLSAYHEGGHIIIEIADDGRGLNLDKIRQKALAGGMVSEAELATLSDQQIMQFIFGAGFSTAEKVTSVSGRGVGMDVVRTNIERIGGTVELSSVFGKGSKFTIKIPLTLAIISVLIVSSGAERFALPQINIQELVGVGGESDHRIERVNDAMVLRLRSKLLPLISLSEVLNLPVSNPAPKQQFIAVCRVGGYRYGLVVDRVFDTEEIVVKPVSKLLSSIPLFSGNTILGDGSVILILDPNGLARASGAKEIGETQGAAEDAPKDAAESQKMSFLLFKEGDGAPKAVPLDRVSRLEEIDMRTVERAGGHLLVQYHGNLMRLCTLTKNTQLPHEGEREVVVFTQGNEILGLVVDEILDIVSAPYEIKLASTQKGLLGTAVLEGKSTDIVDVEHLLKKEIA